MSTVDLHRPGSYSLAKKHWGKFTLQPYTEREEGQRVPAVARWVMLVCSSVALVTSGYLVWSAVTMSPVAGCGGGNLFNCDHVLHSRWSKVLSIPVSVPAILTHMTVIGLLLARVENRRIDELRWTGIGIASIAAGGAAVWFIGLQIFALGHLCPYCLVAHVAGLLLATTYLLVCPFSLRSMMRIVGCGGGMLALLIAMQVGSDAPPTFETIEYPATPAESGDDAEAVDASDEMLFAPPSSVSTESSGFDRLATYQSVNLARFALALVDPSMTLLGDVGTTSEPKFRTVQVLGGVKLSTKDWPLIGSPDAEIVFVEMFDYTCPHCQRTHASLNAAREHFGEKLAVITLPVPLDRKCNSTVQATHSSHAESCDLSKLAVAVWLADHTQFETFHDYLFDSKPAYAQARRHASSLVKEERLAEVLNGSVPHDYIQRHVQLYKRAGSGKIPKIMFPKVTTVGAVDSSQSMIDLINRNR
ncbi:MAG: vitamin K epoxide reductase family protein [Rhodopirellula sp. JB044]|uniref:vitamin K epoxide reductase family protein n=1 Tax=Rhodopirellula sp. JB044 TaxID=3342844 RepID=UPI00370B103A